MWKWKCQLLNCVWLFDPMDCSLPGSLVHGILQARILERVAMPFFRGSSWPRDQPWISCIAGRFFTIWATREVQSNKIPYKKGKIWRHIHRVKTLCVLSCSVISNSLWPIDCKPSGSSVHEISQTRILEQVTISYSRGSSQPLQWQVGFFTTSTT